ncbi:MAG: class II aldolase/adducin family protein, partial [Anaerolineae bacterium]|nr:class II aldolase/adducin family protein [Anaerolineae bacterium]
ELIKDHNALLLKNHGSLHVGDCMDTCFFALERLEHAAKVVAYARMLGKVETLSEDQMGALNAMLEEWGK